MKKRILRKKKVVAVLGSTGNIGQQALQVVETYPHNLQLKIITAGNNLELLIHQAKKYQPEMVYIFNTDKLLALKRALEKEPIKVLPTEEDLFDAFYQDDLDLVLQSMLGFSGFLPSLKALEAGKTLALANKESLVVGGELLMNKAKEKSANIIPVDSEHSAIFQCLLGEDVLAVDKVILTASGGPFFNYSESEIQQVKLQEALKHPTWQMGDKITIDSASMMNKGLEVIEAKWLFNLKPAQIDVLIHPQSVVHSLVQFVDGSLKAQLGVPNMQAPIQYALFYPNRIKSNTKAFNFMDYPRLDFTMVNRKKFRNLALAFEALEKGGNMPAILNAANEAAVHAVLQEKLAFFKLSGVVEEMMSQIPFLKEPSLIDLQETHHLSFNKTKELISKKWKS
ncbi:MAG: 1-deoxy-D-xylulose-5-phosphate reductoisomerase [Bacteroidetes bacterium 4572_77]|nr:MAG: 1-deoxy-D-xylulose-5-phosphate reductoisomerase [Bacteroidetes bacterium 4572_77]